MNPALPALLCLGSALLPSLAAEDAPTFSDAVLLPGGKVTIGAVSWGSSSQLVYLSAADGELLRSRPIPADVLSVAVDPTGKRLAVLCEDREVMVGSVEGDDAWRTFTLKRTAALENGQRYQSTLEFSPSGDRLIAALPKYQAALLTAEGGLVKDWDSPCGPYRARGHYWAHHANALVVVRGATLEIRDALTGDIERVIEFESDVTALDLQRGTALAAVGHPDGICDLVDLVSGEVQASISHPDPRYGDPPYTRPDPTSNDPFPRFAQLAFSPDGRWLAYTMAPSVSLGLVEVDSAELVCLGPPRGGASGNPAFLQWSGDNGTVWSFNSFSTEAFTARIVEKEDGSVECLHAPAPGPFLFYRHQPGERVGFTSPGQKGMREAGVFDHSTGLLLWSLSPLEALSAAAQQDGK